MTTNRREVYMNPLQQKIYHAGARHQRVLAGRRFGKTDGVLAPQCARVVRSMPRGAGIWAGNSRKQLLTRTVPATISAITRFWGYQEGTHFWWGQPPKQLGIQPPIIKPKDWSQCITFYNGWVWHLVSLEVRGSANSMTVNAIMMDEARFISKAKYDSEVQPTLSGITHPLGDPQFTEANPYYKSTLFVSDAALTMKENWMEREEEKCNQAIESGKFKGKTYRDLQTELDDYADKVIFYNDLFNRAKKTGHSVLVTPQAKIEQINAVADACHTRQGAFRILPNAGVNKQNVDMLVNYKLLPAADAEMLFNYQYLITPEQDFEWRRIYKSSKYRDHITDLRCNAFSFYRASTLDNIDILGEDYIRTMKRDLPPIVFAVSILNIRKKDTSDGFYSALDVENVHGYFAEDCPAVDMSIRRQQASVEQNGRLITAVYESPSWKTLQDKNDCTLDGDMDPDEPLHIALDYNSNINMVVTGQMRSLRGADTLMVLNSMYVKNERKLRELMKDWCAYHAPQRRTCRTVFYYYDATAKFRGYAIEGSQDFKDVVIEELLNNGWEVVGIDMATPFDHSVKFMEINEGLAGIASPAIRINRENNEALIIAMENAEVRNGYKRFQKDKSAEKYAETEDNLLEHRTDITDAFDTLYLGCRHYQNSFGGLCLPSGR